MSVLRRNTTLVQTERAQPFDVAVSYMSGASETPFGKTPATFQSIFTGYLPRGLTIYIEDQRAKGSVRLLFDGSATLFTHQDLERLGERLELLLGQVVRNPTTPIAQLPIIPQAEQQKILVEWNDTAAEYPQDKCVHQLFEDQVAKTPDAIALETGHTRLTYSALDTQANRLAHHLRNLGVGPEMRVGLCVERSVDMLVGLLGILKAGAAYVPLDPSYPAERLCYMLSDAGISILVTQSYLEARMPTFDATVVCLDATGTPWKDLPTTSPDSGVTAGNALYVIYTSGSTGRPKGVVAEHHSVVSLLRGLLTQQHRYAAPCKVLHRASLAFDVSVLELLGPLLAGGCVVMAPVDAGSAPAALASLIRRCRVTYADFPPALLAYLLEEPDFVHAESLRVVTVGGEALDSALAVRFTKECRTELWNDYGPTEATVEATAWPVARYRETKSVRIGRPLPGYRVYVVGRYGDLNPIGIPGELCIGGIGVTRGYLAKPGSSAARFVPDPFSNVPGARMYRTADLCRWTEDGELEFLGRIDHQVKIRGFRIELGEVEAVVSAHPSVRSSVALAREDTPGQKRLVVYVVPAGDHCDEATLREHVRLRLPDAMTPSAFVMLDELPLTPNGKVDRRALPAPSRARGAGARVAPRTPFEDLVADAFAQVLQIDRPDIHDNFFALGGHSLLATRVVSRLRTTLGIDLPQRTIFEAPTVLTLSQAVLALQQTRPAHENDPIQRVSRQGPLPLSFAQQRLWVLDQLNPGRPTYNMFTALRLSGAVDLAALGRALGEIVRRHETLRTTFERRGDSPVQVLHRPPDAWPLPIEQILGDSDAAIDAEVRRRVQVAAATPFDLQRGPLFRTSVMRIHDEYHVLLFTMHHIVSDGWSMAVLFRELEALYIAFHRGQASPLPDLQVQLADVAVWQRKYAQSERLVREVSYWKQRMLHCPQLVLPTDHPRPAEYVYRGNKQFIGVRPDVALAIDGLAKKHGATLFMALVGAFQVLLGRYSRQDDFCIGLPIANRVRTEMEPLIGFFVNTLVLRAQLDGPPTFVELLGRVRQSSLDAYAHQDVPFERLVQELEAERDLNRNPVFQVMFVLQNTQESTLHLPGVQVSEVEVYNETTTFDLTLALQEQPDGSLTGVVEYATDLFERETIERFCTQYVMLLEGIVNAPHTRIDELPILTEVERHQVVVEWNRTQPLHQQDRCAHQLFEDWVERTPDKVAVFFGGEQWTYRELNARANQLANRLRAGGVGPEVLVGICMKRSPELLVGILGILKAGGAYVPLDPDYPPSRLAFMLRDAGVPILLTHSQLAENLGQSSARTTFLDTDWAAIAKESAVGPAPGTTPKNLAYVIYTSGSTGQPKGVMVTHENLVSSTLARVHVYQAPILLVASSFAFDVTTGQIFWGLCSGGTLVLSPNAFQENPADVMTLLAAHRTTHFTCVASLYALVLEQPGATEALASLSTIIVGGEIIPPRLIAAHRQRAPHAVLFNEYGPTEATVWSSFYEIPRDSHRSPPIGRPIPGTRIYLLDEHLQPVPIGVPGELCIGGAGVARGYLNRSDLSGEKFIQDPFGPGRLYRTGDLARFLRDGNIEFLGRIDHQVKIRGYRIELGEIEAITASHPGVQNCVVVAREDTPGDQRLVAYVVIDKAAISAELQKLGSEHVSAWRTYFDKAPADTTNRADPLFNIAHWNSSYTKQPIPADQMREWRDRTVERILELQPRRVWEIGCGSGLILLPLASSCDEYLGTDFSEAAIDGLGAVVEAQGLRNVRLEQRDAANCEGVPTRHFDVIILNSIVQYFPDAHYLGRVLRGAARALVPGGKIFLGDIRNHDLLAAFHVSVQRHRRRGELADADWNEVRRAIAKEEELLVAPAYLRWLCTQIEGLSCAEVSLKRGNGDNEMNRYRYDAILYSGVAPAPVAIEMKKAWSDVGSALTGISQWLQQERPKTAELVGVPNARVYTDVLQSGHLVESPDGASSATAGIIAIEPDALWSLAEQLGYRVRIRWSEDHGPEAMDVLWERNEANMATRQWPSHHSLHGLRANQRVNNPLRGTEERELVSRLESFLEQRLPSYMVPSAFVVLDALPLTPNSKVDRKALPAPSTTIRTDVYVAPRTFVEKALADVWAHVLGLERVGIFDNFFELGGDSILTIQIIAKSQRAGFRFSMQQLFQHQTIADLATVAIPVVHAHMQQSPVSGPVVLTPIQQWFFEQAMAEPHHFNQAMLFVVRERVELPALRQAVAQLVDHHDALRLRFVHEGAKVRQVNLERDDTVRVELVDLSAIPAAEQAAAIEAKSADVQRGMSLETGPLMRTVLMDLGPDRPSRLLLVIHHLAVDGVSWRILIEDLETAYHQACRGETLRLPPKTTSFQRWAQHLATYAQSDNVLGELSYWRSLPSATPIPIDLEDGENTVASAKTVKVSLGIEETAALLREVPEILQTQINDVLLFALAEALVPWLGTHRLCIHLEGHGRAEIAPDIDVSRTVGWFTTMFPVVFDLPQAPLVQAIGAVRDQLRRIPRSGLGYGLLRYMQDDAAIATALSTAPQAHVMFNYLGQLDSIAASSSFEFAPESTGPDQSPQAVRSHQIEINGHVLGGRLEFGWTYSANLHTRETIESLAQRFCDSLRVMVAYGRSMKRGEIQSAPDGAGCCLVPLVEGSQPGAIVLFAAVGGHLSSHMIRLARGMGGGRPVLGMTTLPHVGSGTMPKTLEALGGRYARDILARIPCSGPLSFVGYCYGGYSAMETTIHLQRFGRAVDKVVMIEARAPWLSDESATDFDRTTTLVNVASLWGLTLDRAHFVGLSEDEALRKIMAHLSAANLDSTGADRTLRAILDTQQAHREMLDDWQPYEPKAPVYLLRASERSADVPLDYGWKARIALAGVEEVPGDHFGIVRGNNLEVTARTVIQILTRRGK